MAQKKAHLGNHKYIRVLIGKTGNIYYKCAIVGCPHYLKKELVEGRWSICHRCGQPLEMTKRALTLKKPHCEDCTVKRVEVDERYQSILEMLAKDQLNHSK